MNDGRDDDDPLTRALRAVAEDDDRFGASAEVEARLRAEAGAIGRARQRRRAAGVRALAAVLLTVMAVATWRATTGRLPVTAPADDAVDSRGAGETATEFFPLKYVNVPVTDGHTIRLELPQTSLTTFGLEADDASGTVLADVLVGHDGLARAVRFIRPPAGTNTDPPAGAKLK